MSPFRPEHYILLTENELNDLVSAVNRDQFENLSSFLYASNKTKELHRLLNKPCNYLWTPPILIETPDNKFVDFDGNIRGIRYIFPLSVRPVKFHFEFTNEWFWIEFCSFLNQNNMWAYTTDKELIVICPNGVKFSMEEEWKRFWEMFCSNKPNRSEIWTNP